MKTLLNKLVRTYLYRVPITEGKKKVLAATERYIRPQESSVLACTRDGFKLWLNLDNPEHRRIYYYGEHDERYELALFRRILRSGDVCWDIGANIGFYTCFFARKIGLRGRVVAFEPVAGTRKILEQSVEANGFGNVQVIPAALSNRSGTAEIHFSDENMGEGTASLLTHGKQNRCEQVNLQTIDSLELPTPAVVKIDVEGHLLEVWQGGHVFFTKNAPLILAEIKDCASVEGLRTLMTDIRNAGFSVFEIHKRSLKEITDPTTSKKRNFLLAKRGTPEFGRIESLIR